MRTRPSRTLTAVAGLAAAALALAACGDGSSDAESRISAAPSEQAAANVLPTGGSGAVVIGTANFGAEPLIMASIYEQALDAAGYDASVQTLTTRPVILEQLAAGEIDLDPDYIGALAEYLNREANGAEAPLVATADVEATLTAGRELAAAQGFTILEPSVAQDQNAFVVTQEFSDENGVTTLSELAALPDDLVLGGSAECLTYSLCKPELERVYGKTYQFQQTDIGGPLAVAALQNGDVQVQQYLSSDGSAQRNGFVILEDDQGIAPADNLVPVVGEEYGDDALLAEVLNKVSAALLQEDLQNLNASASIDRKTPEQAATDFLVAKGFIPAP